MKAAGAGRRKIGSLATAMACLCAGGVSAADAHLWARAGATAASVEADVTACKQGSHAVHVQSDQNAFYSGGAAGYLALAILTNVRQSRAQSAFDRRCMHRHGYVWLPLSPREEAALAERKTAAEKASWIDAFYASDLTARLEAAIKSLVPALPEGGKEPFTFAAIRLDPATLTVPEKPVTVGDAVLSGKAGHRRTARLANAVHFSGLYPLHAAAGTVFQQLVSPNAFELGQTYWCGPLVIKPLVAGERSFDVCISSEDTGYVAELATGEPWLSEPPDPSNLHQSTDAAPEVSLRQSDVDLIGALDFEVAITKLNPQAVSLQARATRDGSVVVIWSGDLPFDSDGKAVLPFWTHRLVLTRNERMVTAAFPADGDGEGWPESSPAP